MEGLFGLLGAIALGTAIVCLIRPIARIGITSRGRAVLLGVAGLVLLGLAGQREEARESQAPQTTAARSTPPQATAPAQAAASSPTPDEVKANIPPSTKTTAEEPAGLRQ